MMRKRSILLFIALLPALLLSGCISLLEEGALWGTYVSEERDLTLDFQDLLYILTEDDVHVVSYRAADGILTYNNSAFRYSLSEDGASFLIDGEPFQKTARSLPVRWRLLKTGCQAEIGESPTGALGWLLTPFVAEAANSLAHYAFEGALIADIGILLVLVFFIRLGIGISRRRGRR